VKIGYLKKVSPQKSVAGFAGGAGKRASKQALLYQEISSREEQSTVGHQSTKINNPLKTSQTHKEGQGTLE